MAGGAAYSTKLAVRDAKTLTLQENRPRPSSPWRRPPHPRFVTVKNGTPTLDEANLARARRLVGLKGTSPTSPSADVRVQVIKRYHEPVARRGFVPGCPTDLRARPMFHHTREAIEAHLTIVFTALAVSREVQARTGLAIANVVKQPVRFAQQRSRSTAPSRSSYLVIPPRQQGILDAIHSPRESHALR